jgi:RNA recognition motif-containing protein
MGTRLFVGNLPFDVTEAELRGLFAGEDRHVGEVAIITERDTARSRGFGFVEMGSESDAKAAMNALHGLVLRGRALTVNEAREPRSRRGGPSLGGNRPGGDRDRRRL